MCRLSRKSYSADYKNWSNAFRQVKVEKQRNLTPKSEDIGLNSTPRGTVVIKTGNTTVYFKRGDVEQTAFESVGDSLTECIPAGGAGSSCEGRLELALDGGLLELQCVQGLNGGIDVRLGGAGRL